MARVISMSDAINEAMKLAMRRDENVLLIGEDVAGGAAVDHLKDDEAWGGVLGVTKGLVQEFGRTRVLDTPISEAGYMGAAMAAASTGLRPIAELMFNDFIGTCFDQVINQGAKFRYMFGGKAQVPITVRTTYGAGLGRCPAFTIAVWPFHEHPGLKTVVPSNPYDSKGLLLAAIEDNDPVFFFEDKTSYNMKGEVLGRLLYNSPRKSGYQTRRQ
nr:hypothetical protein P5659_00365 [Bacillus subtilis]